VAKPYIPLPTDKYRRADEARSMWSARWGHATAVYNDTTPRHDLSVNENSERQLDTVSSLLVLGGDDRIDTGWVLEGERPGPEDPQCESAYYPRKYKCTCAHITMLC
jgi:hypothetical protein